MISQKMNTCTPVKFLKPAATIVEKSDGFLIEADMPGITREGLTITVENSTLTITGQRRGASANVRPLHRERPTLDYQRTFELGREIDGTRASARLDQGVLQLFLPKSEALKPRRIAVV